MRLREKDTWKKKIKTLTNNSSRSIPSINTRQYDDVSIVYINAVVYTHSYQTISDYATDLIALYKQANDALFFAPKKNPTPRHKHVLEASLVVSRIR